ncbi:MAG: hypothetical protein INR71_07385 [Terriglobus roseus]|nr:hypothetical protein [Terriglobus roseus]
MAEDESELSAFTSSWLLTLPSLSLVLAMLCGNIGGLNCIRLAGASAAGENKQRAKSIDDSAQCIYYLQHIENILQRGSDHTWMTLAGEGVPGFDNDAEGKPQQVILQNMLAQICLRALDVAPGKATSQLQRTALSTLRMVLRSPFAAPLKEMELESALLDRLQRSLSGMSPLLQSAMLQAILAALLLQRASSMAPPPMIESPTHVRRFSRDVRPGVHRLSITAEKDPKGSDLKPPPQLLPCLQAGFASPSSQMALDAWVDFFEQVLPLFADTMFQSIIPLVETFCAQIRSLFSRLQLIFEATSTHDPATEANLVSLMNGLEQILEHAHQRLVDDEMVSAQARSPEQPQGFFANMVPGVFSSEVQQISRSTTANNRLTVLLCFQDTVRICFGLWTWGAKGTGREQDPSSMASFSYTSLRVRNRARRLLEHLFAAEALECLETLCVLWCRPPGPAVDRPSIVSLLNVLSDSKPKKTMPAMFNSLYSRTNPAALEPRALSTLTSDLADTEIAWFLLEYTRSLEDDAMDEIWTDCIAFLRDVLANPMPHRQALPALLEFIAILAEKVENTNFGEERKMRRELGVGFLRPMTISMLTIRRICSCAC